jgi:hypothetical protein
LLTAAALLSALTWLLVRLLALLVVLLAAALLLTALLVLLIGHHLAPLFLMHTLVVIIDKAPARNRYPKDQRRPSIYFTHARTSAPKCSL